VPAGRVYIDPALPPWCPQLQVENVNVGASRLSIAAWRQADGSSRAHIDVQGGRLAVVPGRPPWLDGS